MRLLCLCFIFSVGSLQLHVCEDSPSLSLAAASPVLLGTHSLESEMCLHFEHVTNYLLRLTLRDLAEAFTLLRCCLGQTYFRGWLSQFLSLSDGGSPSQM